MTKSPRTRRRDSVLQYSPTKISQGTVRHHYNKWRQEQGIPVRCDNEKCRYRLDNRAEKLRYLCPNCDSQLTTRGGLNKGRVEGAGEDRFTIITDEGNRNHELFHIEQADATDVVDAEVIEAAGGDSSRSPTT